MSCWWFWSLLVSKASWQLTVQKAAGDVTLQFMLHLELSPPHQRSKGTDMSTNLGFGLYSERLCDIVKKYEQKCTDTQRATKSNKSIKAISRQRCTLQCNKMYDIKLGLLVLLISVTWWGHGLSLSLCLWDWDVCFCFFQTRRAEGVDFH